MQRGRSSVRGARTCYTAAVPEPKVAIIADWLTNLGGAERTILALAKVFPHAPIYTSVFDPDRAKPFAEKEIRTSFLQGWPLWRKHQLYSALRPLAFESFDLSAYDVVISSSSAEAKGVITRPETLHICFCHTPTRYYWSDTHAYGKRLEFGMLNPLARIAMPRLLHRLRRWDALASRRVDRFVANSRNTGNRIRKYYRRPSDVIYPFVDTQQFVPHENPTADYLLVVSRLIPYKRVDLAVEAANRCKVRLIVAGDGPERKKLEALAGPTVTFVGRPSDAELVDLYQHCAAFLFPGEEDFGITPLEAMACGRPVIAFGRGGALETVVDGKTGIFFHEQTVDALAAAIEALQLPKLTPKACRARAEEFSEAVYRAAWKRYVDLRWKQHLAGLWEEGLVRE